MGATIGADIVKQKLPPCNGGFRAIGFGKTDDKMYTELASDHPIDLCRYQVANSYMGRVGLINSGGESHGASDLADAVATAAHTLNSESSNPTGDNGGTSVWWDKNPRL